MAKYYLNNELIDTTAELDSKLAELDASAKTIKDAETSAKTTKETKKTSGKQKLKDLGLDDDEIKALMGA
tara:strand:+ start:328 stop:537 length:210 start_codon:yes stop_codon:yes gene_type:complete